MSLLHGHVLQFLLLDIVLHVFYLVFLLLYFHPDECFHVGYLREALVECLVQSLEANDLGSVVIDVSLEALYELIKLAHPHGLFDLPLSEGFDHFCRDFTESVFDLEKSKTLLDYDVFLLVFVLPMVL